MKPILFDTQMVEAILDGRKTVTRRAIKGFTDDELLELEKDPWVLYCKKNGDERAKHANGLYATFRDGDMAKAPYEPGDILYVRETWAMAGGEYIYRAGENFPESIKWRPSIHMPKEAARIFLRVNDIAVRRLRPMHDVDFEVEGCNTMAEFADLWDSTIKPTEYDLYGWKANPWVWVISFERISKAEAIKRTGRKYTMNELMWPIMVTFILYAFPPKDDEEREKIEAMLDKNNLDEIKEFVKQHIEEYDKLNGTNYSDNF